MAVSRRAFVAMILGGGIVDTDDLITVVAGRPVRPRHINQIIEYLEDNPPGGGSSYTDEQVRDVMATALVAGSNVTITPNDGSDTITIAATGGGSGDLFNVIDYGAVGDGTTNDRAAIQTAYDAVHANGGGTVVWPAGYTFKIGWRAGTYTSGFKIGIFVYGDNVHTRLEGDILLDTAPGGNWFLFTNPGAAVTPATVDSSSWWTNGYVDDADESHFPTYLIDPASRGDNTITTDTAGDAGNFAAGDAIFIRTGQTLDFSGEGLPDSEVNEVVSAVAGTGVITLKYPLAKDYAQEYFPDSGRDNATTTSSTAWAALFGVQNIESVVQRNLSITGPGRVISELTAHHGYVAAFGSVLNYKLDLNVEGTNISPQTGGPWRNADFTATGDVAFNLQADNVFAADKGCGGAKMRCRFVNRGSQPALFHMHEGSYQITVDPTLVNPTGTYSQHGVQILGRSYDHVIVNADIDHNTTAAAGIYIADATCKRTRIITPKRIVNSSGEPITNAGYQTRIIGWGEKAISYAPVGAQEMVLGCVITHESPQETIIGTIPTGSMVTDIKVQVITQFNGAGAEILIGRNITFYTHFTSAAASVDISPGIATDLVINATTGYYQTADVDVDVIYTDAGSTAGRAVVIVKYVPVQRVLGV